MMNRTIPKTLVNGLAVVVILGFVAVIANSMRVAADARGAFGPTVLTGDAAGRVYTNIAAALYVLDARGSLQDSIPLAQLGLQGATLTDLLALPDGRLLVGASGTARILACELSRRRCVPFIRSATRPVSAFKMAWDARRQRLLVVDGERHRILAYDRDGALVLESRGGAGGLKLPNTVLLTADDRALVADTNHHRLVALDAQTLAHELWEMPLRNEPGGLRRIWPTDFALAADGRYWAILDNDLLENGDVLLYRPGGTAGRRLPLPGDWDPIKLHARAQDMLLAGYGSVDLARVDLDGEDVAPFGDAAFRGLLAGVRDQRAAAERWWDRWVWLAIAPLLLLAGTAGWLDWQRRRADTIEAAPAAAPTGSALPDTVDGIYWLQPDPQIVRLWRHSRWLIGFMAVLLLAPALYIVFWLGLDEAKGHAALLLGGGVAFLAMLVIGMDTLSRGRIGVTRDRVVLAAAGRPQRHFYPRQLVYNNRFVSAGEITVFLRTGKGAIYAQEEIRSYLEPRLATARRLNPLQGYIYLLQQGERLTWVSTLGVTCLAGLYLYARLNAG